ncbi:hypothetical protein ALTER154_10320 [Alteromonas sp. 154]|nr:hypothetical protein ALTER154_10320 [Alteromonas sp. 154]
MARLPITTCIPYHAAQLFHQVGFTALIHLKQDERRMRQKCQSVPFLTQKSDMSSSGKV